MHLEYMEYMYLEYMGEGNEEKGQKVVRKTISFGLSVSEGALGCLEQSCGLFPACFTSL